jgi:hypothetical protein
MTSSTGATTSVPAAIKIPGYTSTVLPDTALTIVIDALRVAFIEGHPDDKTPADAWADDSTWSPAGVGSRLTDTACIARSDRFQYLLRFAYHTLGVRADGIDSISELTAAIRHECETTGAVIDLPGLGLVQPSYINRHGLTPAPRLC